MKFTLAQARHLTLDEFEHYAELGLIEGVDGESWARLRPAARLRGIRHAVDAWVDDARVRDTIKESEDA